MKNCIIQNDLYDAIFDSVEVDGLIKLNNDQFYPVERHNTLVVRKGDKHLWKIFEKAMLNGQEIDRQIFRTLLVLGPEGTGKVFVNEISRIVF